MRSPLFTGFIYIFLGIIFTFFAIQHVGENGWGFFSYLLVLLATLDFGTGFRILFWYYQMKNKSEK
jgi:hypothetical protein